MKMNRMRLPPATNPSVVFVLVYKKCLHNFRPSIRPSTHNKGPIAMKRVPREFPHIIPLNGSLCELHKGCLPRRDNQATTSQLCVNAGGQAEGLYSTETEGKEEEDVSIQCCPSYPVVGGRCLLLKASSSSPVSTPLSPKLIAKKRNMKK